MRGGKRKGAGRPPSKLKKVRCNITIEPITVEIIQEAGEGNKSKGVTITAKHWKKSTT